MNGSDPQSNNYQFSLAKIVAGLLLVTILSSGFGFAAGLLSLNYYSQVKDYLNKWGMNFSLEQKTATSTVFRENTVVEKKSVLKQEELMMQAVKEISPSVVSIVITKDMPVYQKYYYSPFGELKIPQYKQEGTRQKEIGSGSGIVVSEDGMILTNKHVVAQEQAHYTVITKQGEQYSAEVTDTDPFQDIALLQIKGARDLDSGGQILNKDFPVAELGNSDKLRIGQYALTIGNALGEFKNTVSVGIISGLDRTITASGGGKVERLKGLIQTDAAVNQGNSGGPLVNLKGEVVGINTAMAQSAENIGFAIPINEAKRAIEQVKESGEIAYPFLGIRYTMINEELQQHYDLEVSYGAWVGRNRVGQKVDQGIMEGTAADRAGLKADDIILFFDGHKLTADNSLADVIMNYKPGDLVRMKILRNGERQTLKVTLGEM